MIAACSYSSGEHYTKSRQAVSTDVSNCSSAHQYRRNGSFLQRQTAFSTTQSSPPSAASTVDPTIGTLTETLESNGCVDDDDNALSRTVDLAATDAAGL
jgi:hypothetical protein